MNSEHSASIPGWEALSRRYSCRRYCPSNVKSRQPARDAESHAEGGGDPPPVQQKRVRRQLSEAARFSETMSFEDPAIFSTNGVSSQIRRDRPAGDGFRSRSARSLADAAGAPPSSNSQMTLIPALFPVSVNAARQYEGTFPGPRMTGSGTSAMQSYDRCRPERQENL